MRLSSLCRRRLRIAKSFPDRRTLALYGSGRSLTGTSQAPYAFFNNPEMRTSIEYQGGRDRVWRRFGCRLRAPTKIAGDLSRSCVRNIFTIMVRVGGGGGMGVFSFDMAQKCTVGLHRECYRLCDAPLTGISGSAEPGALAAMTVAAWFVSVGSTERPASAGTYCAAHQQPILYRLPVRLRHRCRRAGIGSDNGVLAGRRSLPEPDAFFWRSAAVKGLTVYAGFPTRFGTPPVGASRRKVQRKCSPARGPGE